MGKVQRGEGGGSNKNQKSTIYDVDYFEMRVGILARASTLRWNISNKNIGMSVDIAVVDTAQKWIKIKLLRKKIQIENVVMKMKSKMKSKLNQNIGTSVSIAVVNTVQK